MYTHELSRIPALAQALGRLGGIPKACTTPQSIPVVSIRRAQVFCRPSCRHHAIFLDPGNPTGSPGNRRVHPSQECNVSRQSKGIKNAPDRLARAIPLPPLGKPGTGSFLPSHPTLLKLGRAPHMPET
jgi:hypothetical protein